MRSFSAICLTVLAWAAAGCGGGGAEPERYYLGPGADLPLATIVATALDADVRGVFSTQGTAGFAGLPDGRASYTGVLVGGAPASVPGAGPVTDYAADLKLSVDFDSRSISGEARHFVTSLPGFESPEGVVPVLGEIETFLFLPNIRFSGAGSLQQEGTTAFFGVSGDAGSFAGGGAPVASGLLQAEFDWQAGPDAGTRSRSAGEFWLVQD